ncbi:MAG TPA: DUF4156 domain-containing protein [Gemmatimonadaceae bacterium]|jgi:hypothetical protein|nr:DUF4156 domain-containing protein [Gemmatimonadaceae bacterium]
MRLFAVVFAASVVGCASTHPTPAPQAVRITNSRDVVKYCNSLGLVESNDKTNGGAVTQMPVERDRYRRLQNEAAKLGADMVLLQESTPGMQTDNELRGEAYKCVLR